MGSNSYHSSTTMGAEFYPIEFGNYLENDDSTVEDDFTESWKTTLNFTGSNPVYPLEMFISLIEHKYKANSKFTSPEDDSKLCSSILNHISDDELTPAGLWKKQFLSDTPSLSTENLVWSGMKKDLMKHFGQQNTISNKHKLDNNFRTANEDCLQILKSLI